VVATLWHGFGGFDLARDDEFDGFVSAREGESASQAARDQFLNRVFGLFLAENCYSCHGDKSKKGPAARLAAGDSQRGRVRTGVVACQARG